MNYEKYADRPLSQHPEKLVRYAELYATGLYTKKAAAIEAGFKETTADKSSWAWIGRTRADSSLPVLYDYYEKLRREHLREFEINQQELARELALVAFSDITKFVDLPRKEYEQRRRKALDVELAYYLCNEFEQAVKAFNAQQERLQTGKGLRKGEEELRRPKPPTDAQVALAAEFEVLTPDQQAEVMVWKNYSAGSIRIKNAEEIPASLTPAIAELSQTRDGVKIKLHDKLAALDKLARWQKMYTPEADPDGETHVVKTINITVSGTQSTLLQELANRMGNTQGGPPEPLKLAP